MILHDCPYCRGSGKSALNGVYLETLQTMRRLCKCGAYIVANRDAEKFGCKPTALNNRLARLEELGFVVREKYGRQRRFRLTAKGSE